MASDSHSNHGAVHAADAHHGHDDHGHGHGHDDHQLPWINRYIFSSDHKVIGVQYGLLALTFLFIGFCMVMLMRIPIAYGDTVHIPAILQTMLGYKQPTMTGDQYNMYGAMHGTIMVFLAVVPLGFAAFGNYFVPLQIGAIDMAFPRLNMWSFWLQFVGGMTFFASFFVPGGAAKAGWTSYPPLAGIQDNPAIAAFADHHVFFNGQTLWLTGMVLLITASLLGAVNFITTVIQLRAPGMTWMRLPYLTWAMFITAFLLLLAFPPLEAAGIMQLMDRTLGTSFFMPSGLVVNFTEGDQNAWAGGGSPLLYQHLFWFLGHPEVYVLLLPSLGVATEIIACNTRKPIWGYKSMVFGTLALGFLSFIVWAHHMYLTGMGSKVSAFFQTTTMIISIPSVILLTCLFISLWGGSMRYNSAMLFATAFIPMFGMGGLTGLPLGFNAIDLSLHDTYYVIGHFHYMLAPGILFGIFGGIYHYFPKITGRHLNETLGKIHFWGSFPVINLIFFPMLIQGMAGMHRRMFDGGRTYEGNSRPVINIDSLGLHFTPLDLNVFISWCVWIMGLVQVVFIINFFVSLIAGKKVTSDNPWNATTLEWQTPTPPPHGNFTQEIVVYRESYEYSVPGADKDYTPQNEKPAGTNLPGEKPQASEGHLMAAH